MKKIVSLFTILCCVLTFVAFPVMAESNSVVTFYDDFQKETDNAPDNWQLLSENTAATISVESEGDNKYLRLQSNGTASHYTYQPQTVTKPGVVSIDFDTTKTVIVSMKMRASSASGTTTRNNIGISFPYYDESKTTTENFLDSTSGKHTLFCARASIRYLNYPSNGDSYLCASSYKLSDNTWYDVKMVINTTGSAKTYSIYAKKTDENGALNLIVRDAKMTSDNSTSVFDTVNELTNITARIISPAENGYVDLDDVTASYEVKETSYSENFESETDDTPDNWYLAKDSYLKGITSQICTENDNKYLRLYDGTAQTWSSGVLPEIYTNSNFSLPLTDDVVVVKYKTRIKRGSSGSARFFTRLGAYTGIGSGEYTAVSMLSSSSVTKICSTQGNSNLAYVGPMEYEINEDTWYDVYVKINPKTKALDYIFGNEAQGYAMAHGTYAGNALETKGAVDCMMFGMSQVNGSATNHAYIDVDDIVIDYEKNILTDARSFEDNFENQIAGNFPENWFDASNSSTLKIMTEGEGEESNNFVRIEKTTGKAGVPLVKTFPGKINMPYKENDSKGIVVEAKLRASDNVYRSLLTVGAPDKMTDAEYGTGKYTIFYRHAHDTNPGTMRFYEGYSEENRQNMYRPIYTTIDDVPTPVVANVGEWIDYKAIILPDKDEIIHYFGGEYKLHTPLNGAEFTTMEMLDNIAFTWRQTSETQNSYMDFDDVKVYTLEDTSFRTDATYMEFDGEKYNNISKIQEGNVIVRTGIKNGADINERQYTYYTVVVAHYKKVDGIWKLVKAVPHKIAVHKLSYKETDAVTINVEDAENEMIRTFIWNADSLAPATLSADLTK